MSVIGINGSPRPDGSTARLVHEALTGAAQAWAETKLFHLGKMKVAPCRGCMGCRKTARCVVEDDMYRFYQAAESGSAPKGLVVGTPIYFDHVSAQLKTWLDRLYSYTYTERGQKMFPKGYRAVLIATYDEDKPDAYDSVLAWLKERLEFYHEIQVVDSIAMPNATAQPASARPDVIAKAREAGRRLAAV